MAISQLAINIKMLVTLSLLIGAFFILIILKEYKSCPIFSLLFLVFYKF